MPQPCTGSFSGDIRLELRGEAEEAVEAIKGHVSHVADIGWTTNVHGSPVVYFLLRRRETTRELQDDSTHRRRGASEPPKLELAAPSQSLYLFSQSNLLDLYARREEKEKKLGLVSWQCDERQGKKRYGIKEGIVMAGKNIGNIIIIY